MSWKKTILFSVVIGIIVGVLNRIPFLDNTSFQDIAIVMDMWIILALFIIINCKSCKEAIGKCFTFFLISQPIIYLVELLIDVLIYNADFVKTFKLFFWNYYIGAGWFTWTILTIPGAFIAYQVKRDNILSSIILSVATGYLALKGIYDLINTIFHNFPYHLLNSIICLVMAYYLIFLLLSDKKGRIITFSITTIILVIGLVNGIATVNKPISYLMQIGLENGNKIVECIVDDENIATAYINDDEKSINVESSQKAGNTEIHVKDEFNNEYIYDVDSSSKNFTVTLSE